MKPERRCVLVLGGNGFIGRHAVQALRAAGADVVIGSRQAAHRSHDGPPHRVARLERAITPPAWRDLLAGVDVVLNCVGILRPVGRATYERVHHLAVAALAEACAERGLPLVHVSALGLENPVKSGFLRSKRGGELALLASRADWRLARPALLDGDGGFGAAWIRRVARWPFHPVPADARGRLAPLDAHDLGLALASLCLAPPPASADPQSRIYELGGPDVRDIATHLAAMRPRRSAAWGVTVPNWLARVVSHACDLVHATPYSFGHLELLRRDNLPRTNRIAELLGRAPRTVSASGMPTRALGAPAADPA